MIAEIVSVGTELLMGQVVNTDAQFIAQRLAPLGFQVFYHTTVGDNAKRLTAVVHQAVERSDVVVFTGGLGPTDDDLTKETVAAALGLTVELIPEEAERLKKHFETRGYVFTPNNLKQASFPKNATILPNAFGTAPGCIMTAENKMAILLPGPPRELFPMFQNHVMPYLEKLSGNKLYSRELRIFGKGESTITYELRDIIENQTNPTVAPYVKTGEVSLRVTALCQNEAEGEQLARPMIGVIISRLGDIVYSTVGESLPETCARMLEDDGQMLAIAESCTGGMIASELVAIPGCSKFLLEACVTYSDAAKVARLGVRQETLDQFGAVSEQCAREMADGMRKVSGADYALATTGYAGPDGGTEENPVGTVYIALSRPGETLVKRISLHGDRARIREIASLHAFDVLRRKLCLE
ncbi:MAG: competence/damage-inducible protein A [Eubacteriales bacterium]|nr:competence/damage-inducible protein A [Eubacteriales bacterium]